MHVVAEAMVGPEETGQQISELYSRLDARHIGVTIPGDITPSGNSVRLSVQEVISPLFGVAVDEGYALIDADKILGGDKWTDLTDAGETILHTHDHGLFNGLGDDDHPQYPALAQTETITGAWTFNDNITFALAKGPYWGANRRIYDDGADICINVDTTLNFFSGSGNIMGEMGRQAGTPAYWQFKTPSGTGMQFLTDGTVRLQIDDALVTVHFNVLFVGGRRCQFGDAGTYWQQSANGYLAGVADVEITLNTNFRVDANGLCGIGGAPATDGSSLYVEHTTSADPGTNKYPFRLVTTHSFTAGGNRNIYSFANKCTWDGDEDGNLVYAYACFNNMIISTDAEQAYGFNNLVKVDGSATFTLAEAYGVVSSIWNDNSNATITKGYGLYSKMRATQAITTGYGTYNEFVSSTNVTTSVGVYNEMRSGTGSRYGIYTLVTANAATNGYGAYNDIQLGTTRYGAYHYLRNGSCTTSYGVFVNSKIGTTRTGLYYQLTTGTPTTSYGIRLNLDVGTTVYGFHADFAAAIGTGWGIYITGEDGNYFSGPMEFNAGMKVEQATVSTGTTLSAAHYIVLCDTDTAGAAFTITLPAAGSHTDRVYYIKNTGTGGYDVTVDGNGAETIDGVATQAVSDGECLAIVCDGTEWWAI